MSDGVVYELPADAPRGSSEARQMGPTEIAALDARMYSAAEVVVVASLLANVPKFPLDMIDSVLLLADLLVTFEASTSELRHGRQNMDEVYCELRLPRADALALPPGVALAPECVDLVAECASHDQGWASQDNEHDGSYHASFTWSELAVVKPSTGLDAVATPARHVVANNVRARRDFRHHLKQFVDPQGLVKDIALGDTVQLVLRSQYPGWTNTATFGRLRARFHVVVGEDAQLLTLDQLVALKDEITLPPSAATTARAREALNKCCLQ